MSSGCYYNDSIIHPPTLFQFFRPVFVYYVRQNLPNLQKQFPEASTTQNLKWLGTRNVWGVMSNLSTCFFRDGRNPRRMRLGRQCCQQAVTTRTRRFRHKGLLQLDARTCCDPCGNARHYVCAISNYTEQERLALSPRPCLPSGNRCCINRILRHSLCSYRKL